MPIPVYSSHSIIDKMPRRGILLRQNSTVSSATSEIVKSITRKNDKESALIQIFLAEFFGCACLMYFGCIGEFGSSSEVVKAPPAQGRLIFGFVVAAVVQISSVQCFFIESLTETLFTSGKLHHNESTNSLLQENISMYKTTPENFAGQMSNNTLNTLYNSSITNSSIQDVKNSHDFELNNFIGKIDYDLVTKSNFSLCQSCTCGKNNQRRRKRIAGGVAAEQTEFPWMAALVLQTNSTSGFFTCGAVVITKRHLLTATHCVLEESAEGIIAWLGSYNLPVYEPYRVVKRVERIIQHPGFNATGLMNDIAILKLDSPISFNTSYIQPACLPQFENINYTGRTAIASGWGRVSNSSPTTSDVLRKVELLVGDCRKILDEHNYIDDIICTSINDEKKDSCRGDSGGPLHIYNAQSGTMEVIGITSAGTEVDGHCADDLGAVGLYARIATFMPWINKMIDGECLCVG